MSTLPKVYIDGHVGTTGLRIREWLEPRQDIEIVTIPEALRKDENARREHILASDVTVFCLPDDAAREAAKWAKEGNCRLIDASTAHRVADGWVYGLPELQPGQRDAIRNAKFVSNPGCYSSSFILLLRPLIDAGLVAADAPISIHALSGHSGGGRSLMERWEDPSNGLIGAYSADEAWVFATAWHPYQELFQGVARCLHSDFRIGGLQPGEGKTIRGASYLLPNQPDFLLARYRRDFPEHFPKPAPRPATP